MAELLANILTVGIRVAFQKDRPLGEEIFDPPSPLAAIFSSFSIKCPLNQLCRHSFPRSFGNVGDCYVFKIKIVQERMVQARQKGVDIASPPNEGRRPGLLGTL